jgi:ribose 5-phosphate isomerase B
LKERLLTFVHDLGHDVEDFGATELDSDDDYPDFVTLVAERVAHETDAIGIVIGGSGQGEAMCANRVQGVRAAVFYGPRDIREERELEGGTSIDEYEPVRLSREHNNANVLSIGSRFVSPEEAEQAVRVFLDTQFSEGARHVRRLAQF